MHAQMEIRECILKQIVLGRIIITQNNTHAILLRQMCVLGAEYCGDF